MDTLKIIPQFFLALAEASNSIATRTIVIIEPVV
jgi:hypothetical protein